MKFIFKLLKLLGILISTFLILLFGTFIYLKPQWKGKISAKEMNVFTEQILVTPKADSSFVLLYQKLFPENLKGDFLTTKLLTGSSNMCSRATFFCTNTISMTIPEKISFFQELESRVAQEDCLNCYLERYDFLNQAIGLEKASEVYFQKNTKDLNLEEQLTIIVMLKNLSYYNPKRRPEIVEKEVLKLKSMLAKLTN